MIAGYFTPTEGRVSICGHDVETDTIAAQANLGYLPEGAPAYGDMTPRQFLVFIAEVRGFTGKEAKKRAAEAAAKTELEPVMEQPIDTLSKGFKRRVGLAQAILHDPPVLVMDEPTDGLDPNQKHSVRQLILGMAAEKAIIISTHLLEEVEAVCTRAVIIDRGRIVADGTPSYLLSRSRHHNAVTITLPVGEIAAAKAALEAQQVIVSVEEVARHDGVASLTAFPRANTLIVENVIALAGAERWDVKELYAETGRLEDVFRAITTPDAQRARERAGAAL
jgi:ABC-2 type transport system ATP-binding protein